MEKRTFVRSISSRRIKLSNSILIQHIRALTDDDLLELVEFADRTIMAEEFKTQLRFPHHHEAKDVVSITIKKMLQQRRGKGFDPNKGSIKNWVKGSVKSEIQNIMRLTSSRLTTDNVDEEYKSPNEVTLMVNTPKNPEQDMLIEEKSGEFWVELYDKIEGDSDLEQLVNVLEEGFNLKKSKELAEKLGWTVKEVNNAKKRFLRLLRKNMNDFRSLM